MLSYTLGTLRIDKSNKKFNYLSSKNKGYGIFGYQETRDKSIIVQLSNYADPPQSIIDRLTTVLDDNDFNIRMLVAADIWYRGNNTPNVFNPNMFKKENNQVFLQMSNTSFGPDKKWNRDSLGTLLIYGNYLKNNVYKETDKIIIAPDNESDAGDIYFDEDD